VTEQSLPGVRLTAKVETLIKEQAGRGQVSVSAPVERLLSLLIGVRKLSVGKWQARCPAHDDRNPSLSVSQGWDGRALIFCHAGCEHAEILKKLDLELRDLFVRKVGKRVSPSAEDPPRLTVEHLAQHFRLDARRLWENGVEDSDEGVFIRYLGLDGKPLERVRVRVAVQGAGRFKWKGRGPISLYGLNFLSVWLDALSEPFLVLVEGESDCWAAWRHGVPALGIPSVSQVGKIRLEFIERFSRIFILREPDWSGEIFVESIPRQLSKVGWTGELFEIRLDRAKDLAELHRQDASRFDIRFRDAIGAARKLSLPTNEYRDLGRKPSRRRGSKRREAEQFLRRTLASGEWVPLDAIKKAAEDQGIKWPTVRRAAKSVIIEKRPTGFGSPWSWRFVYGPLPRSTALPTSSKTSTVSRRAFSPLPTVKSNPGPPFPSPSLSRE